MSAVSERREIRVPELGMPISHYTDAVALGNVLYISGVVGHNPSEGTISDDVVEQTRQLFTNMRKVLDAAGATPADVVKVTVYLLDMNDRTAINPLRAEFFGDHRPASTIVQVSQL